MVLVILVLLVFYGWCFDLNCILIDLLVVGLHACVWVTCGWVILVICFG